MTMRRTSVQLDDRCMTIIRDVAKTRDMTFSEAIRFVITRYEDLMEPLNRAGIRVREYPAKVELELPR